MKFEYNLPDLIKRKRCPIAASFPEHYKQQGIYALFYRGKLIYVGQTINFGARLSAHRMKYGHSVEYTFYELPDASAKELSIYEAIYINHYNPLHNIK